MPGIPSIWAAWRSPAPECFAWEATACEPRGRITPNDLGLWDDATEAALGNTLAQVRAVANTAIAIQLAHAGRKGSCATPWEGGCNYRVRRAAG